MTREELEHAIRAACDAAQDQAVYVFGSQAILGQYPDAPESLRQSAEADIAPVNAIDMVDVIDASLGELSSCHQAFGYYVHGVAITAAVLPQGWERRPLPFETRTRTGQRGGASRLTTWPRASWSHTATRIETSFGSSSRRA